MPNSLLSIMKKIARKKPVKILVCEGWDERCLRASAEILKKKIVKIVLLGNKPEITKQAKKLKVDISNAEMVDYKKFKGKEKLVNKLVELRKHKGITTEEARKLLEDENYFGCMYVLAGYADGLVGSAICPTAALMRPALQLLRQPGKIVNEVSIVKVPQKKNQIYFVSDCSLNINPSAEELAQIAVNTASVARTFKYNSKVAFLSYSTKGSGGDGEDLQLIRKAVEIAQKQDPQSVYEGEMQVDAAVDVNAAKRKCPHAKIKGDANVLIFPNLMASNILTHALMRFSDVTFYFTILKGMKKSVGILGRSTPMEVVRNIIISVAMEANSHD